VHRKKDATDWGVEPQINVPMDAEQERAAMQARYEQELFRRPAPKATTQATTTQATTQAIDPQLQRAVDTMIALVVLQSDRPVAAPGEAPVVEEIITEEEAAPPATQPIEPTEEIIVPGSEPATAPAATQPGT
jgi:hypothetical protein